MNFNLPVCRVSVSIDDLFIRRLPSLTLTLSPRRGDSKWALLDLLGCAVYPPREFAFGLRMILPLLGGEGRGEGERLAKHLKL